MTAEILRVIVEAEVAKAIGELKKFTGETNNAKASVGKFQQSIISWVKGLGAAYVSIRTLQAALRFGFDASKLAAEANQISTALDSMARSYGTTADSIIDSLKKASGGTISELELMQSASKAALFDLPLNQLDRLMEIARASATATGQSVQFMFDSIVTGIARGSPLILDNLGLTLKIGEATEEYAQSIGKTTEELTAEERKMATLNATLEAGGKIIEKVSVNADKLTDLQKWQKYEATMKDLRLEVGKFMLPAFASVADEATRFGAKLRDIIELRNIMRSIGEGTATTTDRLRAVNIQLEQMNLQMQTIKSRPGGDATSGIVRERIMALQKEQEWLKKAQYYESLKTADSFKAADAAKKAAEAEAAKAEQALQLLAQIDDAYKKTPEGARAALEAQIAMWEGHLKSAGAAAPKILTIIADLRAELASMNTEGKASYQIFSDIEKTAGAVGAGASASATVGKGALDALAESARKLSDEMRELTEANDAFAKGSKKSGEAVFELGDKVLTAKEAAVLMQNSMRPFTDAFGAMIVGAEDAGEALKNAIKGAVAAILEMLALKAFAHAADSALAGNFLGAAAWTAAGSAAMVSAGVVKAMAEGGIVTKPTHALIGERGPEAVIPLNKAGAMGPTIIVNVQGSVLEEEGLARRISKVVAGVGRGY